MIGNDVIDLAAARKESNWKRKGFLDKLFTLREQEIIHSYDNPELMVWVLWSMKEASYKIYNRKTGIRAFMPLKLECSLTHSDKGFSGITTCCGNGYHTETTIANDLLHTVAVMDAEYLESVMFLRSANIIKDSNGLPFALSDKKSILVSKSHHGRFQKIVCLGE